MLLTSILYLNIQLYVTTTIHENTILNKTFLSFESYSFITHYFAIFLDKYEKTLSLGLTYKI